MDGAEGGGGFFGKEQVVEAVGGEYGRDGSGMGICNFRVDEGRGCY